MAAARNNRKRRQGRGRLASLFKLLCMVAVVVAVTVGATVFFRVETVAVSGNSRYTQEEIVAATGIHMSDNLFHMNKFELRRQVQEQLPYIHDVLIRRSLPSTIVITVTEWDAVAQLPSGQGSWLISVGGKLLEPAPADSQVMEITGLTPLAPKVGTQLAVSQQESARLQSVLTLLPQLLEQELVGQVSTIQVTGSRLLLRYQERFTVKLPLNADFSYQLSVLKEAVADLDQRLGETATGTLDLAQEGYHAIYSPE